MPIGHNKDDDGEKKEEFCYHENCVCIRLLTINSRRNLSSSRAAGDVLFKCC